MTDDGYMSLEADTRIYLNAPSIDATGGSITADAFYESSDERIKTFKKPINVNFDELSKLKKSYFIYNNNPTIEHIGVSAQEIQKLYPEVVNEGHDNGYLTVDYSKLSVIALAAIDKLYKENQELKERIKLIEDKLN